VSRALLKKWVIYLEAKTRPRATDSWMVYPGTRRRSAAVDLLAEPMAGGPIPLIGIGTSNWDPLPAF